MNPPLYQTVTAMIAPALFLTATASLIISTANRMGRIIDRIRKLVEVGNEIGQKPEDFDFADARLTHIGIQLDYLQIRNRRVMVAVTELYLAFGAFVGSSLTIAVDSFTGHYLAGVPTVFATAGVGLLFAASINLVFEARSALRTNHVEVEFYRELSARRREQAARQSPGADHLTA
ncbi:DUF2721 domain-containing protein [Limnoglobus roseus]|uniref:DUF2721 domain-containing protein n=1 Tax=Limnoglobus roseus TaxID=2598579 RepID=A0A5C1AB73_9BACT|nr:DUF2721 domain-containing protein [Limnoglobus roseus]QEL15970.1 hypothetical protein PX52LOC_02907 [Limnoglobus roseus]